MKKMQLLCKAVTYLPAVLAASLLSMQLSAQVIMPASHPDNAVGSWGYPNSASIDYTPNCTALACSAIPNPQLTATVIDDGPGGPNPPMLYVTDQVTTFSCGIPLPFGCIPDVTIGNDISTSSQYIIGVVGVGPTGMGNDATLITYVVTNVGTGFMNVTSTGNYNISLSGTALNACHIDIEAQHSTSFLGLPRSNNFAMTWQDGSGIRAYFASLNTPTAGTYVTLNANLNLSFPDVALVERFNPCSGAYEDWVLAAYLDLTAPFPTPHTLYYQEWNTASALPAAPVIYDNSNRFLWYGQPIGPVRIDAIDDFNTNNPGPSTYGCAFPSTTAFFCMVTCSPVPMMPLARVLEYNNLAGPLAPVDITSAVGGISANKNVLPVVACGPGQFYTVAYKSTGLANLDYYATSVDWGTGSPTTDPNAYTINMNPFVPSPAGVALAGTCNTTLVGQQQLFAAWESSNQWWDKYSLTAAPYGFRHIASQTQVVKKVADWQLSPNPAVDEVELDAPSGFSSKDGDTYRITDLSGRELQHGSIISAAQQINISSIPAGMYLLNISGLAATVKTIKFVKE